MAGVANDSPLDRRLVVDNANIMSREFRVTMHFSHYVSTFFTPISIHVS